MKKVHISLVGGQPVPVFIGIKDDGQANTVVLVCSHQSHAEADRIKDQFPKRSVILKECSPVDLDEIETLVNHLDAEYADYERTVNLTSGTKLWSLSFFRVFNLRVHTHFIYVDQTNKITDILTKESHFGKIDTLKRIELYGTSLTSFKVLDEYTQTDFDVMRDIAHFRKINKIDFAILTSIRNKSELKIDDTLKTDKGSQLEYSLDDKWARMSLKTKDGSVVNKEFQCEHLFDVLFNSGWFELMTAKELRQNKQIKNIWLNCEFAYSEGSSKNEVDIIAEFGNRLLFVECKTMIRDNTDLDKFRSALRNFSGTSTTGLFVTYDKPNEKSRERYEQAMEKCKDNEILTFNFSLWKGRPVENLPLNTLVNTYIQTQNKR